MSKQRRNEVSLHFLETEGLAISAGDAMQPEVTSKEYPAIKRQRLTFVVSILFLK